MIYKVPKAWKDKTCVILAGGPSLRGQDLLPLRRHPEVKVITINDSWRLWPRADVCYFCDPQWFQLQQDLNPISLDRSIRFHDLLYRGFWVKGGEGFDEHPQVRKLRFSGQVGLDPDPTALRDGSNSGYQAIHLAYHFGVKRIILLGYDMTCDGERTHWHDAPRLAAAGFQSVLSHAFLPLFDHLAAPLAEAGVEVINSTPKSALTLWPHLPLEEALTISHPVDLRLPGSDAAERSPFAAESGTGQV
jgi:hypothetical protein